MIRNFDDYSKEMAEYGVHVGFFDTWGFTRDVTLRMKKDGVPPEEIQEWYRDCVRRIRQFPPYDKKPFEPPPSPYEDITCD